MNIQQENTASTSLFGATNEDMMCTPSQRKSRRRTQTPTAKQESGRKSSYKNEIMEDLENCPLKGLTIYVEIFSNKVNISETAYKQLEELGAQIEKRMNKKCNLVIWKDGSPRTLQRAKKYEIPVVNSLWLADCVDNFKRADVAKYTPSKLDQEVALFSVTKATKKRKRFVMENLHSDTKADRKHSRSAIKRLSSLETHKTKMRKTKSITKQNSDTKITVRLKRKDSKKREVARSLSFDTNPKATKRGRPKSQKKAKSKAPIVSKILFRSGSLHRRIIKTRNPDLGTLDELKVRKMPESEDEASEKSYYSERREVASPGDLDIDGILAEREKAQESSRIREMILRYASIEYPIAVEAYNMVSDQDTNIEDGDLDFSVKSPVVRPFEYSEQLFDTNPISTLENNHRVEIDFAQLQPTCFTGGDMLEEKEEEEEERNGIEIENENEAAAEASLDKVICESPPMDTLKPEGSNTFETPVTKAGTSMNKDSIEKAFSTPAKKSSDMKRLIDNIYSDFKGIEEVKEEITDSTMLMVRGRRPTREKLSAGRTFNYTLRSNSKEKLSVSSKNDDIPIVPLATTRQPRQKKSSIVAKGLTDSGLGRMKGKQNTTNTTPRAQSRPQSQSKGVAMEEEKVASEEAQKRHNVLFSNLKRTELPKMKDFCDKYGLNYLEDRINNAENIEVLVAEKQEIPQNFKTAVVMAKGKAIVKREWIVNSIKKDKLLDYEYFMIPYNHDQRKGLFNNKKFYIDPEIEDMPINMVQVQDIAKLITATAGIVSQDLKECDFCIRRKTTKKELLIPSKTKAVTLQWLIDSVLDGKIMDTNNSNYKVI